MSEGTKVQHIIFICLSIMYFGMEGSAAGAENLLSSKTGKPVCTKSVKYHYKETVKIPCFPDEKTKALYFATVGKMGDDLEPSYKWFMPESLTPQNTEKDISKTGFGALTVPELQPDYSGLFRCQVAVVQDDENTFKQTYEHLMLVTKTPKYSFSATYSHRLLNCRAKNNTVKEITTMMKNAMCQNSHCVAKIEKKYCETDNLVFRLRGPLHDQPRPVVKNMKELKAYLESAENIYRNLEERREPTEAKFCPAGYGIGFKEEECIPCPPGHFSHGRILCKPCNVGQWQDFYGSFSCYDCPSDSLIKYEGASSISECYSTEPADTIHAPVSCQFYDRGFSYTPRQKQTIKSKSELRQEMINMLYKKLETATDKSEISLMEKRIAENERAMKIVSRTQNLLDSRELATLKAKLMAIRIELDRLQQVIENDNIAEKDKNEIGGIISDSIHKFETSTILKILNKGRTIRSFDDLLNEINKLKKQTLGITMEAKRKAPPLQINSSPPFTEQPVIQSPDSKVAPTKQKKAVHRPVRTSRELFDIMNDLRTNWKENVAIIN